MRSTPTDEEAKDLQATNHDPTEARECSRCRRVLPLTEFRWNRRRLGQRHADCRSCRRIADQLRRAQRAGADVSKVLALLHRARSVNETGSVLTTAIHRFGGAKEFAAAWWRAFEASPPSSSFGPRSLVAILRLNSELLSAKQSFSELHQTLEAELADQQYDFDSMSDEELAATIEQLTEQRRQQAWLFIKYLQRLHEENCLIPTLKSMLDSRRLILSREDRDSLTASLRFAVL